MNRLKEELDLQLELAAKSGSHFFLPFSEESEPECSESGSLTFFFFSFFSFFLSLSESSPFSFFSFLWSSSSFLDFFLGSSSLFFFGDSSGDSISPSLCFLADGSSGLSYLCEALLSLSSDFTFGGFFCSMVDEPLSASFDFTQPIFINNYHIKK